MSRVENPTLFGIFCCCREGGTVRGQDRKERQEEMNTFIESLKGLC